MVLWMLTVVESRIISYERCDALTKIPQEREYETLEQNKELVPAGWPTAGHISIKDLYIRYRPDLDYALNGISLEIQAYEKVGVVGRTGAGKSTIILALLRLLEADKGSILIDDVDISLLG